MSRVPIALFPNLEKAEVLRKRLAEAGIAAEIHNDLHLHKLWFVSKEEAGFRIEVPSDQFDQTERLLTEWDHADPLALAAAVRCPECHSLRVEYPQHSGKSMIPNAVVGLLAAVGGVKKHFYCHDCHFSWPREGTQISPTRPNAAPYYFIEGVEQTGLHSIPHQEAHSQPA